MPSLADDLTQPTDAALSPIERARAAAEARQNAPPPGPPVTTAAQAHSPQLQAQDFHPSRQEVLPFHRLLDSDLLPKCSKPQAVKTLETLQTLLSNILFPPNPLTAAKFRQIRLSNTLIRTSIVEPANGAAQDYLVASGFRAQNVEFTPYLVFSPSPTPAMLHKLRVAHHVVGLKLGGAKEADDREKRHREAEKEAEAARKEKALLGYEEDRRLRAERDEREKHVRDARPPPENTYTVRSTGRSQPRFPGAPRQRGNGGASRQRATSGDALYRAAAAAGNTDPEGGEDDAPPAYGELHGRVLGTGLPPPGITPGLEQRGVRMVNQQDVDEEDEDDEDYNSGEEEEMEE